MTRKETREFGEVMRRNNRDRGGVQLRLKFPAVVFNKLLEIKKRLEIDELHDLYVRALEKYLEILQLVIRGYQVFAATSESNGIDLNTDTVVRTVDVRVDKVRVVTEVTPRFSSRELGIYLQIENIFKSSVKPENVPDMNTIFVEAITVLVWIVDRSSAGKFIKIKADKNPPQGVIVLPFSPTTLQVKRS